MMSGRKNNTVKGECGIKAQKACAEVICSLWMDSRSRSNSRDTCGSTRENHRAVSTALSSDEIGRKFPVLNSMLTGLRAIGSQMSK